MKQRYSPDLFICCKHLQGSQGTQRMPCQLFTPSTRVPLRLQAIHSFLFLIEVRPCAKFCSEDEREARLLFWSQASGTPTRGQSHLWNGSGQVFVPFGWANEDSLFLWGNVSPYGIKGKGFIDAQAMLWSSPVLFSMLAAQESKATAASRWWEEGGGGIWEQVWPQESGPWVRTGW